jgi:hypothetical protein
MKAHSGAIRIPTGTTTPSFRRRLASLRAAIRRRRAARAARAYSLRASGAQIHSVPGSEHSHEIRRPRGF